MKILIVFGNDHTNTVGVIQSLGKAGYMSVGLLFGQKTRYVSSSNYTVDIITGKDPQDCIDKLLESQYANVTKCPIVACCDMAALTLEKNSDRLRGKFVFEYAKNYSLEFLAKKRKPSEDGY